MKERENRKNRGIKFHPNKTFKIYPFYNHLFSACISLNDRDVLKDYLIKKYWDCKELKLPSLKKIELFEKMIKDIAKSKKDFSHFYKLYNSKRFKELKKIYESHVPEEEKTREVFNIRASEDTIKKVFHLSEKTGVIAEVLELAIINYIYNLDENYYELVKFSFELHTDNEFKN